MAEETVLLNFEIDQGQAQSQLVAINKSLLNNKEAQQELNKAYKAGTVSQDEYVKENIKLQANIKKEQEQIRTVTKLINTENNSRNAQKARISELTKEYDNLNVKTVAGAKRADALQKELSELNAEITKSSKSAGLFKDQIGKYPESFGNAAKSINVAGVSVGDIGSKLASFANPATAAIGIVTALGAAYANSTAGSRDLSFASAQLSSVVGQLTEDFGNLVTGGTGGGQGKGLLSTLGDQYLRLAQFTPIIKALDLVTGDAASSYIENLRKVGETAAKAAELLNALEVSKAFAQGFAKEDERRAELQRRIRDDEAKTFQQRLEAAEKIDPILEQSAQRTITVLQAEIKAVKESTINYDNNLEAQLKVAKITAEIKDKEEEITGKLTENVSARRKILDLINEEANVRRIDEKLANAPGAVKTSVKTLADTKEPKEISDEEQARTQATISNAQIEAKSKTDINARLNADILKSNKEFAVKDIAFTEQSTAAYIASQEAKTQAAVSFLQASAGIFQSLSSLAEEGSEEQKQLAIAGIAVDTASALVGGVASAAKIGWPQNLAAIASTVAVILSNVAQANSILNSGYADGGYTGDGGKHEVAGTVHKGEYVVPKHIVQNPIYSGQIAHLESARRGYVDGGFVTRQATADVNNSLIVANALRNMPVPVVSVKEITKSQKRITVKEAISTLR